MYPIHLWRFIRLRWWLIALPIIAALLWAIPQLLQNEAPAAGGYSASFRYSAAQVTSPYELRDGDYQDVWLASEFVVNAFTDWVRSGSFRNELEQAAPSANVSALGIAADNDRSIGLIQLSHPDADQLNQIAAATIEILQTRNVDYFPHLGGQPAQVTLLDAPTVIPQPAALANRFQPLLMVAVAGVLGVALALLRHLLDHTIRYDDELSAQGISIMGRIPKH